jgi:hypothetical protein
MLFSMQNMKIITEKSKLHYFPVGMGRPQAGDNALPTRATVGFHGGVAIAGFYRRIVASQRAARSTSAFRLPGLTAGCPAHATPGARQPR